MKNNGTRAFITILVIIIICLLLYIWRGFGTAISTAPPSQAISIEKARELEQEYVRTRYNVINKSLGYNDTREFLFSLEEVEQYIAYVKSEAKKKGYKNLGLRIYYGAYPSNSQDKRADPGFSTVFIVPTAEVNSPLQSGFFPIPPIDENLTDLDALNYTHGGKPPKEL